jgi:hypothetical protein
MEDIIAVVIIIPLLIAHTLGGVVAGYAVSLFFDETLHEVIGLSVPALKSVPLWKIGATLGFVGGFFRTTANSSKKS